MPTLGVTLGVNAFVFVASARDAVPHICPMNARFGADIWRTARDVGARRGPVGTCDLDTYAVATPVVGERREEGEGPNAPTRCDRAEEERAAPLFDGASL